jgi:hypothetical protein
VAPKAGATAEATPWMIGAQFMLPFFLEKSTKEGRLRRGFNGFKN